MQDSVVNSSIQPMTPALPLFSMDLVRRLDAHVATCTARGRFLFVRDVTSRTVVSLDSAWTRSNNDRASSVYSVSHEAWVDWDADGRKMERTIAP